MRVTPSSRAMAAPSALDTVIWVEACSGNSGQTARASRAAPRSCTRMASAPERAIAILHQDGVRPGAGDRGQGLFGDGQLAVEHQRVEGDEPFHALAVEEIEDARQLVDSEVVRAGARVEAAAQPEVDGVGAGSDGGAQA